MQLAICVRIPLNLEVTHGHVQLMTDNLPQHQIALAAQRRLCFADRTQGQYGGIRGRDPVDLGPIDFLLSAFQEGWRAQNGIDRY